MLYIYIYDINIYIYLCIYVYTCIHMYLCKYIFYPIQSYSNLSSHTSSQAWFSASPRPRPGLGVPSTSPAEAAAAHVAPFGQGPWSRGTSPRGRNDGENYMGLLPVVIVVIIDGVFPDATGHLPGRYTPWEMGGIQVPNQRCSARFLVAVGG